MLQPSTQHVPPTNSPFPQGQAQKQLSEPSPLPPKQNTSTQSSRSTASERTTPSPGQAWCRASLASPRHNNVCLSCACFMGNHPSTLGVITVGSQWPRPCHFPGRGGEQGDPWMPALFSLGQRGALQAIQSQLQPNELLLACLDDLYAVVQPDRARAVYDLMAHELFQHPAQQLENSRLERQWHHTTRLGTPRPRSLGRQPALATPRTRAHHPWHTRAVRSIHPAPAPKHTPKPPAPVATHPRHRRFASLILLLFCASPRCNHILRTTAPALAADFAADHDVAVTWCLQQLLGGPDLPATALATAHVPLAQGGLGLQSATATAPAAYWASWADTMPTLVRQFPADFFSNPAQAPPCIQAAHHPTPTTSQMAPRHPAQQTSHTKGPPPEAGSTKQQTWSKPDAEHNYSQLSTPLAKQCSPAKPAPIPAGHLRPFPSVLISIILHTFFGFCYFVVYASHSSWPLEPADAVAL